MASPMLRVLRRPSGRHFIVDGLQVYAESDSGRIRRSDLMLEPIEGVDRETLVNVAKYFRDLYDAPYHGAPYVNDPALICAGPLNKVEAQQFHDDPRGSAVGAYRFRATPGLLRSRHSGRPDHDR
jgi:hypothetical protein